jgi:hypothetical protein
MLNSYRNENEEEDDEEEKRREKNYTRKNM